LKVLAVANVETLYRLAYENCQLLLNEIQKRGINWLTTSKQGGQLMQLLDWLYQLLMVLSSRDRLLELSLVSWSAEESESSDTVGRTLNRVAVFLSNN
jgi:hypothetical protein